MYSGHDDRLEEDSASTISDVSFRPWNFLWLSMFLSHRIAIFRVWKWITLYPSHRTPILILLKWISDENKFRCKIDPYWSMSEDDLDWSGKWKMGGRSRSFAECTLVISGGKASYFDPRQNVLGSWWSSGRRLCLDHFRSLFPTRKSSLIFNVCISSYRDLPRLKMNYVLSISSNKYPERLKMNQWWKYIPMKNRYYFQDWSGLESEMKDGRTVSMICRM